MSNDSIQNAERLLRHLAELKWMPEGIAESLVAAADALAAERERRGEPWRWAIEYQPSWRGGWTILDDMLWSSRKDVEREIARRAENYPDEGRRAVPIYAAPPLPPAMGEEKCADCGCVLDSGTAAVFTVCDACWDKAYRRPTPPATGEGRDAVIEECAKVCERVAADYEAGPTKTRPRTADVCANAIRALKSARPTPEPSEAMVEAVEKEKDALRTSSIAYHSTLYVISLTEAFAAIDRIAALAAQEGEA